MDLWGFVITQTSQRIWHKNGNQLTGLAAVEFFGEAVAYGNNGALCGKSSITYKKDQESRSENCSSLIEG
tara:strand:- start:239 stop:448 length:210 start_codon:yes stop_codon:yes gene_type:complete